MDQDAFAAFNKFSTNMKIMEEAQALILFKIKSDLEEGDDSVFNLQLSGDNVVSTYKKPFLGVFKDDES